jgi:hypothetical protein
VRVAAACLLIAALVGCREKPTTVQGLVTLDGKPLAIHKGMRGSVVFQPATSDGVTLTGLIDGDGRYELAAGGSLVVPARAYWVTVSAMEMMPATDEQPQPTARLITPAKYASATDSGFRVEVMPGPNQVDLPMESEVEAEEVEAEESEDTEPQTVDESTSKSPDDR